MKLEMVQARMQIGSNDLFHLFQTKEQVRCWKENGHQLAEQNFRKKYGWVRCFKSNLSYGK